MYFGSVSSPIYLVGETSTSQSPLNADGAYNGMWATCGGWTPVFNNHSLASWAYSGGNPRLNTGQSSQSNLSFATGYRFKDRLTYVNLITSNSAGGTMYFTSPFSISSTTTISAYKNMTMSNTQNFLTTNAIAKYGYTFAGYRLESSSGTLITFTANHNWYYNSSYGNVNMSWIKNFCCTWIG